MMRLLSAILLALALTAPLAPAQPVPVRATLRGHVLTVTWEGAARACVTRGTHGYPLGCGRSPLRLVPLDSGLLVEEGEALEVRQGERVIGRTVVPWVTFLAVIGGAHAHTRTGRL